LVPLLGVPRPWDMTDRATSLADMTSFGVPSERRRWRRGLRGLRAGPDPGCDSGPAGTPPAGDRALHGPNARSGRHL